MTVISSRFGLLVTIVLGLILSGLAPAYAADDAVVTGAVSTPGGAAGVHVELLRQQPGGAFIVVSGQDVTEPSPYTFTGLPAGTYRVRVSDPQEYLYPATSPDLVVPEGGQVTRNFTLSAIPLGTVTGRVTDADGDPISDAWVTLFRITTNEFGVENADSLNWGFAHTDANGDYQLTDVRLDGGDYTVKVEPSGLPARWYGDSEDWATGSRLSGLSSSRSGVDIGYPSVARVSGQITDAGVPLEVASLLLYRWDPVGSAWEQVAETHQTAPTDGGHYAMAVLPGDYAIEVQWFIGGQLHSQWLDSSGPPAGPTAPGVVPIHSDRTLDIALNPVGTPSPSSSPAPPSSSPSTPSVPESPVSLTASPRVTGSGAVFSTLSLYPGAWTGSPLLRYQWLRSGRPIAGADGSTYRITRADIGHRISVRVTATGPRNTVDATTGWIRGSRLVGTITARLRRHRIGPGQRARIAFRVRVPGRPRPRGRVVVLHRGRVLADAWLRPSARGRATVRLPRLPPGRYRLRPSLRPTAISTGATTTRLRMRVRAH